MTSREPVKAIAFLVQGLFEISDSIGFDCIYQARETSRLLAQEDRDVVVHIFAERFIPSNYPDVIIGDLSSFYRWTEDHPNGLIIYHYCGEWKEIDDHLIRRRYPSIVRWHNNTPPWFYMKSGVSNALHTLSGFDNILRLIESDNISFWVNSEFTKRQYLALGGITDRVSVVFPASRYLYKEFQAEGRHSKLDYAMEGFDIIFVGRIVHHKGYKGIILTAQRLAVMTEKEVRVHLPGRIDVAMRMELTEYAARHNVDARFYGEVSETELAHLYSISDVFLCLSEHEGFGLPVFEAMSCDVPVVAWANAAFSDLLSDHPLAFHDYDINQFVAAIMSLCNEAVRGHVLTSQRQILKTYDAAIVGRQVREALQELRNAEPESRVLAALPSALRTHATLAAEIAHNVVEARRPAIERSIRDSGSNLYSLYDLDIYRTFLDARSEERRTLLLPPTPDPHLTFIPSEFTCVNGQLKGTSVELQVNPDHGGHIIFGPYVQFPAGRFTVEFLLQNNDDDAISLLVDVTANGQSLAEKCYNLLPRKRTAHPPLGFHVKEDGMVVEFRMAARFPRECTLAFHGVKVRRT